MVLRITAVLIAMATFCVAGIPQTRPPSEPVITIKRESALGCTPDYSAEIYGDGTVIYHGEECVKVVGERHHKISTDRVAQLVKAFEQKDYFSFKDRYESDERGVSWTDTGRTTTSISLNGMTKKVVESISPPKELVALEELIEKLAGLYEYIGPL